jgi:hypothetical protein
MIEFMSESSGNVTGIRATGKLTDADYKQTLIPRLESLFGEHGKVNVLFYMDESFEGWDLDDRADFEKLAVVGGPAWVDWCIKLGGFLMKGEIRIFPVDQLDRAWNWVKR